MKRITLDRGHGQQFVKDRKETARRFRKQIEGADRLAKRLGLPTEEEPEAPKAS